MTEAAFVRVRPSSCADHAISACIVALMSAPIPILNSPHKSRYGGGMNESRPEISTAEWRVMHEVWQFQPVSSATIIARLSESTDWTPGTIKTLLHRLVQKGALEFQRKGNRYLYRACVSEYQCMDDASDQLLHTIFHGRPIPMLTYLVQSSRLSGSEIEVLQQTLARIKADLPSGTVQDKASS